MENSKDSVSDLIFDDQKLIEMQFEKINQQQRDSRIKSMKFKTKEKKKSGISSEIEKFIGENLINKIGIADVIMGAKRY